MAYWFNFVLDVRKKWFMKTKLDCFFVNMKKTSCGQLIALLMPDISGSITMFQGQIITSTV